MRLREAERQAERQTALARRDVVQPGEPRHRDRRRATRRGPRWRSSRRSWRSSGCRRGRRWSRRPRAGWPAPRPRCATRAGGSTSGRSPRRSAGAVADVFRRAGEIAGPAEPVVSILPDGAYKVVVFVGETGGRRAGAGDRARGALRRLPGRADRDGLLRRRRAGVHAAGDLLGREPAEARLPGRGAAVGRARGALRPGQIVDVGAGGVTAMADTVIDVRHLTKRFGGRAVVDDVSMTVRRGEIVGFLGPNGSGKTTTIRMMCGLLRLDAGEGEVLGHDLRTESPGDQGPGRLHDAEVLALRGPDDRGEPGPRRRALPAAGRRGRRCATRWRRSG